MSRRMTWASILALAFGLGCRDATSPYADIITQLEVDETRVQTGARSAPVDIVVE